MIEKRRHSLYRISEILVVLSTALYVGVPLLLLMRMNDKVVAAVLGWMIALFLHSLGTGFLERSDLTLTYYFEENPLGRVRKAINNGVGCLSFLLLIAVPVAVWRLMPADWSWLIRGALAAGSSLLAFLMLAMCLSDVGLGVPTGSTHQKKEWSGRWMDGGP